MTALLQKAFSEAAKLSPAEQDVIAERLLAELSDDDEFDRTIAATAHKLANLGRAAIAEHRAGLTKVTDPLST